MTDVDTEVKGPGDEWSDEARAERGAEVVYDGPVDEDGNPTEVKGPDPEHWG